MSLKKALSTVILLLSLILVTTALAGANGKTLPTGREGVINLPPEGEVGPTCFSEDFENGLGAWTLTDNSVPTGAVWTTTADTTNCNVATSSVGPLSNYTGGGGEAACLSSDLFGSGRAIDTTMCTPLIDISGLSAATLSFLINAQSFTATDSVVVSVNGTDEATLLPDLGTFLDVPGSFETVDLSAYAGNDSVELCFTYIAGWDWYAQVDEIRLRGDVDDVRCDAVPTDVSLTGFGGDSAGGSLLPVATLLLLAVAGMGALIVRRKNEAVTSALICKKRVALGGARPFFGAHHHQPVSNHAAHAAADSVTASSHHRQFFSTVRQRFSETWRGPEQVSMHVWMDRALPARIEAGCKPAANGKPVRPWTRFSCAHWA